MCPGWRNQITLEQIQGNETADLLARQGSDLHISWSVKIPPPGAFYKEKIKSTLLDKSKDSWMKAKFNANSIWVDFDHKLTKEILSKGRKFLRKTIFLLTGHWNIGRHARRIGIKNNISCPGCGIDAQDTDMEHVWCLCPALVRSRLKHLGKFSLNLWELKSIKLDKKLAFITAIDWW